MEIIDIVTFVVKCPSIRRILVEALDMDESVIDKDLITQLDQRIISTSAQWDNDDRNFITSIRELFDAVYQQGVADERARLS